ncbi:hypothetical protein G6F56_002486 [Rhizopus delemar]|uniref:CBS domain-containing protein n=1 Tax=Rhizopus stolonifer TaxID=4846 RepID=A0A367KQY0_RHIST|nr:hypothetical protein G6F56_002486 [Rhizopus delemar]RCI04625.1 hypothetical protein CU098_012726 [Rhizopus stolonifer]
MLVIESAQFMSAKRCDCVLVVNEEGQLSGIFTAKDIAYRLVAEGLDAGTTAVSQIMTKNPLCVTLDTSATEALDLMVSKGFRHLPVRNENGDIFGLLDITKCLYQTLEKLERAFDSSKKLYDALEGVERNWANDNSKMTDYLDNLRETMACPTLRSVLDGTLPAEVKHKANVRDIAILMKEAHTTAVLVTRSHKLQGIFTSKDIVLRVIAAGLNPDNTTVARVMTPKPDTATPETTVLDALKLMNDGHYLNLPVIGDDTIIGMVDVLKLTYITLEQINSIQGNSEENGAIMSRFWENFGSTIDPIENQSQVPETPHQYLTPPPFISPQTSTSTRSYSDVSPNEYSSMTNTNEGNSALTLNLPTADDTFTFKFTLSEDRIHRTVSKPIYKELLESVRLKLSPAEIEMDAEWLFLSYLDDENDQVLISCDSDVIDATNLAVQRGNNNVKLFVQDNRKTKDDLINIVPESVDNTEDLSSRKESLKNQPKPHNTGLLLPMLVGILGVAIISAYAYSKAQLKSK